MSERDRHRERDRDRRTTSQKHKERWMKKNWIVVGEVGQPKRWWWRMISFWQPSSHERDVEGSHLLSLPTSPTLQSICVYVCVHGRNYLILNRSLPYMYHVQCICCGSSPLTASFLLHVTNVSSSLLVMKRQLCVCVKQTTTTPVWDGRVKMALPAQLPGIWI